jgi:DNA replication and repair protein RecF
VNAGSQLCAARARAIAAVAPHAQVAFEAVGGTTTFTLAYAPNVSGATAQDPVEAWAQAMRDRLAERAGDERIRGITLVGPHRDDLEITLGGLGARAHASHGEGWLAALALALGAHATLTEVHADPPVLLLDDPFTLLDPSRRALAVRALPTDAQIIVTAADPAEIPPALEAATLDILRYRP